MNTLFDSSGKNATELSDIAKQPRMNLKFMAGRFGQINITDTVPLASVYQSYSNSLKSTVALYGIAQQYGEETVTKILRSLDGGINWTSIGTVPCNVSAGERLQRIFVCPYNETIIILKNMNIALPAATASYHVMTYDNALVLKKEQDIGINYWHASAHNVDAYGNTVMMAEYGTISGNKKLWRSLDGGITWADISANVPDIANIRHLHVVQSDPFTGHWWLGSGDSDAESKIWKSTDAGVTWTIMGQGSQEFRTLSFVFESDYMYYGMDCPLASTPSKLFRVNKDTFEKTAIAETYKGNAIYSLCRTFFPAGILVYPNHEPTSQSSTDLKIQFYDFVSNTLRDVATIQSFGMAQSSYWGFNESGRYQCRSTGIIVAELAGFSGTPYYRGLTSSSVTGWLSGELTMS